MKNSMQTENKAIRTAKELAEALDGKRQGRAWIALCPAHSERTPSFYLSEGENRPVVFKCFAGCSQDSIIGSLASMGLWHSEKNASECETTKRIDHEAERLKFKEKALKVWWQSSPVKQGDPVHTYLKKTRRLPLATIPAMIRCAYDLEYWVGGEPPVKVTSSPAMVAAIQNVQGDIIAIHRTYLAHTGEKLDLAKYGYEDAPVKKVLGKEINGAAIRLQEPDDTLIVAEGIETALAAHILSGLPAWAAVSAGGLERIEIPASVEHVIIAVDNDAAGEKSSAALAARLQQTGYCVSLSRPPVSGTNHGDWADVLRGLG